MRGNKSQRSGAPTAGRHGLSRLICVALFLCLAVTRAVKVKRRDDTPGRRLLKVQNNVACVRLSGGVAVPALSLRAIGPH